MWHELHNQAPCTGRHPCPPSCPAGLGTLILRRLMVKQQSRWAPLSSHSVAGVCPRLPHRSRLAGC